MKYWAFLAVKLLGALMLLVLSWKGIAAMWPEPEPFMRVRMAPFARDLNYTAAVMLHWLVSAAILYLVVRDHLYRCRTCLRKLRMPVSIGTWQHLLFGPPRTDYICPYGHGTLRVPDLHNVQTEKSDWKPIDDMWKELESLGGRRR